MNKPKEHRQLVVALDIGTSKIAVVVAELKPEGGIDVIGMGSHPSRGMRKGMVVDIEATVNAIQRALEEAELMADCKIKDVYTGIAGSHIKSYFSDGAVPIKNKEITALDVERAIETAKAIPLPSDHQVLHVLTRECIVDDQRDVPVRQPIGMSGVRLDVYVHIVTGAVSAVQNIVKCARLCGLEVQDLILQPLASATAVLSNDEKELGVCLVDIGGGTTDIAIFARGAIQHTAVIPIAGDQVTNDIAMAFRTPIKDAEDIKQRYGCALRQLADPQLKIAVPDVGGRETRELSQQALADVIEPRVEELYALVQAELRKNGREDLLSSGVVLTGGSSLMRGMTKLGEEIFHLPVRVGLPHYQGSLAEVMRNPRYSTAVGLLLLGAQQEERAATAQAGIGSVGQVFKRMKTWIQRNF